MGLLNKWTGGQHEAPAPLEGNVVATVTVGTAVWFLLLVVQLPFHGWYEAHGHTWFLWTCLAGGGLGLFGLWLVRRRERAEAAESAPKSGGEAAGHGEVEEDGA